MSALAKPDGIVCIINNLCEGQGDKERRGSKKDVEALVSVFSRFNWKFVEKIPQFISGTVHPKEYHSDLDRDEIENVMKKVVEKCDDDDDEVPRFVFVMTHGNKTKLEDGKGNLYDPHETILKYFSTKYAPHLDNSMKLLVIQSCRGSLEQPSFDNIDSSIAKTMDGYFKNTFIARSTITNYTSVRFPTVGTPYIQTFCEAFDLGQSLDIIDFFMDVAERVKQYHHAPAQKTWVITPEFGILGVSTLHKKPLAEICNRKMDIQKDEKFNDSNVVPDETNQNTETTQVPKVKFTYTPLHGLENTRERTFLEEFNRAIRGEGWGPPPNVTSSPGWRFIKEVMGGNK